LSGSRTPSCTLSVLYGEDISRTTKGTKVHEEESHLTEGQS
jgi:hypothetical protein